MLFGFTPQFADEANKHAYDFVSFFREPGSVFVLDIAQSPSNLNCSECFVSRAHRDLEEATEFFVR